MALFLIQLSVRTDTARTALARALGRASVLSTVVLLPFAAEGTAELLRERTAATFRAIQDGAILINLFLLHATIGVIQE